MEGGFTFNGIHSSTYGVVETPESRVLMPEKVRTLIDIPGRSTSVIQETGSYNSRVESILCHYVKLKDTDVSVQRQVRLIAGWLSGVHELTFDYEPEMHYNAFLSGSPPTEKHLEYASFTLEFTCNHPFAYETAIEQQFTVNNSDPINLYTEGTVETPARIIIKNTGTTTINNLILRRRYVIQ